MGGRFAAARQLGLLLWKNALLKWRGGLVKIGCCGGKSLSLPVSWRIDYYPIRAVCTYLYACTACVLLCAMWYIVACAAAGAWPVPYHTTMISACPTQDSPCMPGLSCATDFWDSEH